THDTAFTAVLSTSSLTGGTDGDWRTDLEASPRLNRAARDWSRSYFTALSGYGIDITAAFSMELRHGDPSPAAGIAQRYPDGEAVSLNTPAVQTNFSPASITFWKEAYREIAQVMDSAEVRPYLQFGEVQWWYFPNGSGMPFYDAYTTGRFLSTYGHGMGAIADQSASPDAYPEEVALLSQLIGEFTAAVIAHVRTTCPEARFEVLY